MPTCAQVPVQCDGLTAHKKDLFVRQQILIKRLFIKPASRSLARTALNSYPAAPKKVHEFRIPFRFRRKRRLSSLGRKPSSYVSSAFLRMKPRIIPVTIAPVIIAIAYKPMCIGEKSLTSHIVKMPPCGAGIVT